MIFSKDFIDNQVFEDSFLTKNWYPDKSNGGANSFKNMELQEDGSWLLHIHAPQAKEVKVIAQYGSPSKEGYAAMEDVPVFGEKDEEGTFHVHLPWHFDRTGSRSIKVFLDGTLVIWPYFPVAFGSNRLQNYLEFPDEELSFSYIRNVPHGALASQSFHSSVTGREERCMVYMPASYTKDTKEYPVLYLMHGGSDNETSWFTRARLDSILDNLLAEKKCVPFLVVTINDMYTSSPDSADRDWSKVDGTAERVLIQDCIPFIEKNYRVKTDKWDRAIGGLSLGALQACDCGFRHPELFGSMGFFTSIFEHENYTNALGRPWTEAMKNAEKVKKDYRLIFCSATPQEDHYPYFLNDGKIMEEAGLKQGEDGYVRICHDGRITRWSSWRLGLKGFAERLFREG